MVTEGVKTPGSRRLFYVAVHAWIFSVFLIVGCSRHSAELSSTDRNAITNTIVMEHKGNITDIELLRDGSVRVSTLIPGRSGGDLLTVKKSVTGWEVIKRGVWMN
jgi:hypothetical protein